MEKLHNLVHISAKFWQCSFKKWCLTATPVVQPCPNGVRGADGHRLWWWLWNISLTLVLIVNINGV